MPRTRPDARIALEIWPPERAKKAPPMPHLLLVDDDDLFRESLGLNLIDEGYEITSFCNGYEALFYLESGGFADVALLALPIPTLTRLQVVRPMRHARSTS